MSGPHHGPHELTDHLPAARTAALEAAARCDVELLGTEQEGFGARGRAADVERFGAELAGAAPAIRPVGIPALPGAPAELRTLRDRLCAGDFLFGEEEVEEAGDRTASLESDLVEVLFVRTRGRWTVEVSLPDWDAWHDLDLVLEALGTGKDLPDSLDELARLDPRLLQAEVERRRRAAS